MDAPFWRNRPLYDAQGLVFRFFVVNHIVHHRTQLASYLRECDARVPGKYGPSADEGF